MKLRDRVLQLFEDDVASALLEFGKTLSKLDVDIVVFLARKSLCLYDVLLRLGTPPIQHCVVSDRVLDMCLDPFRGKRVALVDDTLIVGTSVAKLKLRLEKEANATVTTHVFCLDTDWYCKALVAPDTVALALPDERVMTFCTGEVRALSVLPRPYLVDFPLMRPIRLSKQEAQCVLSSTNWFGIRLSTVLQENHNVSVITFFPTETVISEIETALGCSIFGCLGIIKVRAFAKQVGNFYVVQLVPIVTLKPIKQEQLDLLARHCIQCIQLQSGTDLTKLDTYTKTPFAKQRLVQYVFSAALAGLFSETLKTGIGRQLASHIESSETDRHFGPWLHDEMGAVARFARFAVLGQHVGQHGLQHLAPAQLPKRVVYWSAETIGTDRERKRFKTRQPRHGQVSLLADFAEIFRRIYDKREIPARREAQILGRKIFGEAQQTPKRDRLEMGVPWQLLVEWMAGLHNVPVSSKIRNIFSLLLDLCNDLGIAVPVTCCQEGVVFRGYRHGEDVKFADGELALSFEAVRGFLVGTRRDKIPRLPLEKLLVLLIKVGFSQRFLDPLYGATGAEGTCRIGFHLKGARALFTRGPKDRADRNLWLSEYLVARGVLQEDRPKKGKYRLGGKPPEGNFLAAHAPGEAFVLGCILGTLMRQPRSKGGILDEEELTLLATCATPQHTANALQVELDIFRDWFERDLRVTLRELLLDNPESLRRTAKKLIGGEAWGHEALYSAKFKFVGYRLGRVRRVIERCQQFLSINDPVSATKWNSYWKTLVKTDRKKEESVFEPLIDKAAILMWQAASCLSVIEIAIRYKQSEQAQGSRQHLDRAFAKLRDFRREMTETGITEPQLTKLIAGRFERMETLHQTEFLVQDGSLVPAPTATGTSSPAGFRPDAAIKYAEEHIAELCGEISRLIDTIEPIIEDFGRTTDRYDFRYMLYYDIVDSTATKIGKTGVDVEQYRMKVMNFKRHVNSQLDAFSRNAAICNAEVFCQNGNKSSTNDCKHVFFRGGPALKLLNQVAQLVIEAASNFGIRIRVHVTPCNFAGTSAYRQGFDPEVRGERFWEHWSRVGKAAGKYEESIPLDRSFLMLATPELHDSFRLPVSTTWESPLKVEVVSEIELLSVKTVVMYGAVHSK